MAEAVASVRIQGADALILRLGLLQKNMQRNIMRGALRAASKPIIRAAQATVPVRTGTLKRSIRFSSRGFLDGSLRAEVKAGGAGLRGRSAFYAHIVERGAKPHSLVPRGKDTVTVSMRGRVVRTLKRGVGEPHHKGFRARRYMARAAEASAAAASDAFADYVAQRLRLVLVGAAQS